MPVSINTILNGLGIGTADHRAVVKDDLLPAPDGLGHLINEDAEGITEMCASYYKSGDPANRFKISRTVVKRLISLMHWAKDLDRVDTPIEFENGTTPEQIVAAITEATTREQCRKTQRKTGESLVTNEFVVKLKNSAQWERWKVELKSTLSSIIGAKGVPLSYVIREDDDPQDDPDFTWDERFEYSVVLEGPEYSIDRRTVHQIILRNVAEDSDAYTYIKPRINREDGRIDIKALKNRYDNQATQQGRINSANRILDTLVYKNERAMSFELFSSKIQEAVDNLHDCGRAPHDGDVVDKIWTKMLNPELTAYVEALKVQYNQNPRPFREILLDIATQIPNLKKVTFRRNVSEITSGSGFTRDGECPKDSVYTVEGKLFIGTYPGDRWFDEDVKPYHDRIREFRKKNPRGGKTTRGKKGSNTNRSKRKIKKLKARVSELEKSTSSSNKDNEKSDEPAEEAKDDAGNAFGGRKAKKVKITKVVTGVRRCKQIKVEELTRKRDQRYVDPTEMDSHADTIVAGRNTLLLSYTDRVCEVSPYSDEYQPIKDVPVVSAATGYTSACGENFILILNEALWMPNLNHSLINPNQLRHHGVEVQDNPYAMEPMTIISHEHDFCACLESNGSTIFIKTWTPTQEDLESYPHIHLSSSNHWNPQQIKFPSFSLSERAKIESRNLSSIKRNSRMGAIGTDAEGFEMEEFNDTLIESIVASTRKINKLAVGPLDEEELEAPRTFISSDRHSSITAEDLSERWCISVKQAQMTLDATTRRLVRSAIMPLSRRYRVDRMFGIRRLNYEISTDTIDGKVKSIHGDRYAQIFGSKEFFVAAYPMGSKSEAGDMLDKFVRRYGAPKLLKFDGSKEQCGKNTKFQQIIRKYEIPYHIVEHERPNQNPAESVIRELKKKWYRILYKMNCPIRLWDYGLQYAAEIMNVTASNSGNLNGRTPLELITGETPDISEYLDFGFYDRIWFREHAGLGETKLGRFLGVSGSVGSLMSYWVLPSSGIPEARTTVSRVTQLEMKTEANKERFKVYDEQIMKRFKEARLLPSGDLSQVHELEETFRDDEEFMEEFLRVYSNPEVPDIDNYTPDVYDPHVGMQILMDRGGNEPELAKVIKRLRDEDGNPIGVAHDNPLVDTRLYEIEYEDGYRVPVAANVIAENLFNQVNDDGYGLMVLDGIVGHRTDGNEVTGDDAFIVSSNGTRRRKETTKGHHVLLKWKDGTSTWNTLKDVKDSYPVQLATYAIENNLDKTPAFAWWVPYVIRKRNRIINKLKSKYWSRTHKYGIRIPKNVAEALEIDRENGNTLWWDAIMLEMKNVRPAFEVYEGDIKKLVGYQKIKCHFVFDVKLGENFRRKARLVGGGHTTDPPSSLTYSSVVSRDSVRILLLIAALNGLDILTCDIQNAYLTAECREKIYTIAGPEFGSEEGSVMLVKMALYGLKSSGAAFRSKLANVIYEMGYRPSLADPDVWMRPGTKVDGFRYYEYILCYVDDVLVISDDPETTITGLKYVFKLKGDKAVVPDMYLGATLTKVESPSGSECWSISSEGYVKTAIGNVEKRLEENNLKLPSKCPTPTTHKYRPEDDQTKHLEGDDITYFQELIGVLRWAIEIGRADILLEVALLSSQLAAPRVGHMEQVYHIFGYLKKHPKRKLYMDPDHPEISENRFKKFDWEDFYWGSKEPIPTNIPKTLGRAVALHCFVDADHASDKVSRRSQTGIIVFGNKAPLIMYSKKQNSVQTSTFGSEFMAMRQAVEIVQALRFKLRMFGIPLDGPASMYCDNEAVYKNIVHPDSVLKKKHHSVAYHMCREAVASEMIRVAKESSETNIADLFTKPLSAPRRECLLDAFMY